VAGLQRAVQCITREVVHASSGRSSLQPLSLTLARGDTVPLTGGPVRMGFRMRQAYDVTEDRAVPARRRWRVVVTNYFYTFEAIESGRELFACHWHPDVIDKAFPHVHLESGLGVQRDFVGVHVPTGSLVLEDVIRFAIEELRVRPRVRDWAAVLERSRAAREVD
jgi:hypothetical protein